MQNYPPLIITTAVFPRDVPYLSMTDSNERITKYIKAVQEWRMRIPTLKIILCDGTGFDWGAEIGGLYDDINFEFLSHINDVEGVKKYGKGFGEIQTLNFVVDNSVFLKSSPQFMKITGKYWVSNINSIPIKDLYSSFKCKSIYKISNRKLLYINSAFYISSVEFYKKYFYNSYKLINDHMGDDLEHVLAKILIKERVSNYQFRCSPDICGWTGTSNSSVDLRSKNLKDHCRKIKYWLLSWIL